MPKSKRNRAGNFIWNLFTVKVLILDLCNPFAYWVVVAYSGSIWWLVQATWAYYWFRSTRLWGCNLYTLLQFSLSLSAVSWLRTCFFFLSDWFWLWPCTNPNRNSFLRWCSPGNKYDAWSLGTVYTQISRTFLRQTLWIHQDCQPRYK